MHVTRRSGGRKAATRQVLSSHVEPNPSIVRSRQRPVNRIAAQSPVDPRAAAARSRYSRALSVQLDLFGKCYALQNRSYNSDTIAVTVLRYLTIARSFDMQRVAIGLIVLGCLWFAAALVILDVPAFDAILKYEAVGLLVYLGVWFGSWTVVGVGILLFTLCLTSEAVVRRLKKSRNRIEASE